MPTDILQNHNTWRFHIFNWFRRKQSLVCQTTMNHYSSPKYNFILVSRRNTGHANHKSLLQSVYN